MSQTPREIVQRTLKFETPERLPRDLWALPWATKRFPEHFAEIQRRFPGDFRGTPNVFQPAPRQKGDMFAVGEYVDEWGCLFHNIHEGVIGEVKTVQIPDIEDLSALKPPYEILPADPIKARDIINNFCANTDYFVTAGCCPRPWERYQFLRGSENALMDVMMPEEGMDKILVAIHDYYMKELEFWVTTDVDSIGFMDDWGSQWQLLIPPPIWRELFKPLYKDYCDIAHANGKFAFMHSDGYISEVYSDIIEVGVDALNSQLFVMDIAELGRLYKGKITFWGEIDRQHILSSPNPQDGRDAVRKVAQHMYDPAGGIIAQCEFGPGANPNIAIAVFEEWEKVQKGE
jgi:uroporphyrinogen decarboxylase